MWFGERLSLTRFQFRTRLHLTVTTTDCFKCEGRCKWSARKRAGAQSLRCPVHTHLASEGVGKQWTLPICQRSSAAGCDVFKGFPVS